MKMDAKKVFGALAKAFPVKCPTCTEGDKQFYRMQNALIEIRDKFPHCGAGKVAVKGLKR